MLMTSGKKLSETDRSWKSVSEVKPSAAEMDSPNQRDLIRKEATAASVGVVSHIVEVIASSF